MLVDIRNMCINKFRYLIFMLSKKKTIKYIENVARVHEDKISYLDNHKDNYDKVFLHQQEIL